MIQCDANQDNSLLYSESRSNGKESEKLDPLDLRRTTFQMNALSDVRLLQKNKFQMLKQAARQGRKRRFLKNTQRAHHRAFEDKKELHAAIRQTALQARFRNSRRKVLASILQDVIPIACAKMQSRCAVKIQAAYRGFRFRQNLVCFEVKRRKRYHRQYSEITMSDLSDSFHTLGSIHVWSPRTSMRNLNSSYALSPCGAKPNRTMTSDIGQNSFNSIFPLDSTQDLPVRPPERMNTPTRMSPLSDADASFNVEELSMPEINFTDHDRQYASLNCIRTTLHPRNICSDRYNASFNSYFVRDTPVKLPERMQSIRNLDC